MSDVAWTIDRVGLLKNLWADGLSASQIASELGSLTRNAVIGKLHRLGLTGQDGGSKQSNGTPKPRAPRAARPVVQTQEGDESRSLPLPPRSVDDLAIAPEQRRTLMELTNETCRWPVGELSSPDFFYCGAPANNAIHPYCQHHRGVASAGAPRGMPRTNGYRTFR